MKSSNYVLLMAIVLMVTGHLYGLDAIFNNPALNQQLKPFPLQILAENSPEGLFQVHVQQQSGAQCGWNGFKNALFGVIALQAYQAGNQQGFLSAAQSMTQETKQSRCIMDQVGTIAMRARHTHNQSLPAGSRALRTGGEDLYPEEIQAVIDNINLSTCGVRFDGVRNIIVLPEAARLQEEIIVGGLGVSVLNNLQKFVEADNAILPIILSFQSTIGSATGSVTGSGWHWIATIAIKHSGVIQYLVFDSMNHPQVETGPAVDFVNVMNNMTSEQLRDAALDRLLIILGASTQSVKAALDLFEKGATHIVANQDITVAQTPLQQQKNIMQSFGQGLSEMQDTQYHLARMIIEHGADISETDLVPYISAIKDAADQLERVVRGVQIVPSFIKTYRTYLPVPMIVPAQAASNASLIGLIELQKQAQLNVSVISPILKRTIQAYGALAGATGRSYVPIFLQRIQ